MAHAPSFFSLSTPPLVSFIQQRIRVHWHYDRDDEEQIGAPDRDGRLRGGCHAIVHMQVAENGLAAHDDGTRNAAEEECVNEGVDPTTRPASKRHKTQAQPPNDSNGASMTPVAASSSAAAPALPATAASSGDGASPSAWTASPVSSSGGVRDLDIEPLSDVLTRVLTPSFLSRATVVLPHSARWHALFYAYYQLFIADQQSQHVWRTSGCPVWLYRFDLNIFHQRLRALKQSLASEHHADNEDGTLSVSATSLPCSSPLETALELSLLDRWRAELLRLHVDLHACPDVFPIYLANYSNRCALTSARSLRSRHPAAGASPLDADPPEEPWVGELLVFPLRTIHAVLDACASGECVRVKYYLGVYTSFPEPPAPQQCPTGICVAHGPDRGSARAFERAFAAGEGRSMVQQQWSDVRLDRAAWQLWRGGEAAPGCDDQGRACVKLPVGVAVELVEKSAAAVQRQSRQCAQLLSDLEQHTCSLIRGVFPSSLSTARGTLSYLHALMRLPPHFSLTSTAPFHALAFHDARWRPEFGLEAHHLRRQSHDQRTTHVQASHGNTAYGALCAPAVEAALFLQPLIHMIWHRWQLGRGSADSRPQATGSSSSSLPIPSSSPSISSPEVARAGSSSVASATSPRLYTLEVAYQAPLPDSVVDVSVAAAAPHTATAHQPTTTTSKHKRRRRPRADTEQAQA